METFIKPIYIDEPPKHTQIKPRCLTCKKTEVCSLKADYFKTLFAIQKILGDPQRDYEISHKPEHSEYGFVFEEALTYIPESINTEKDEVGSFSSGRYCGINYVSLFYKIDDYIVDFSFKWDCDENTYKPMKGREVFYRIPYHLSVESISEIVVGLEEWRKIILKKEREREGSWINTTAFSALLNCKYYEQDKNHNNCNPSGHSDCCCNSHFHHVATFHYEPQKSKCITREEQCCE